jgi:membrane-bound inhibitor of C-type lysozyme
MKIAAPWASLTTLLGRWEWNKVTWYSKIAAVVLFVATFYLGFYIGSLVTSADEAATQVSDVTPPGMDIINAALFTCSSGQALYATFRERLVTLVLSDGRKVTIPQAISASGARYATPNESFVFWNKGNTAFIQENGKEIYSGCVTKEN